MKLSKLVEQQNMLNKLSIQYETDIINTKLETISNDINNINLDLTDSINKFTSSIDQLHSSLTDTDYQLHNVKRKVTEHRTLEEVKALTQSTQIYEMGKNRRNKTNYIFEEHNKFKETYDPGVNEYYETRIKNYSDWQHPGVLIRPLNGEYINSMLSLDPLYLIDENKYLLAPSTKLFTEQYQNRLRYKTLLESDTPYLLDLLPHNSIGFMLINEFFDSRPIELIKTYLEEVFQILKPGGTVMFTFNNCDIPQSCRNFEVGAKCYVPASLLIPIVEAIGFELTKHVDTPINVSWLELTKPGDLTSLKGGQTLAEIK